MTAYWPQAAKELGRHDRVMKTLIAQYEGETLAAKGDAFFTLARAVVGQQISVKAADTIWGRFAALGKVEPAAVLRLEESVLRGVGLSSQKVKYLTGIAQHFEENPRIYRKLHTLDDAVVTRELVKLPGIGQWTAEMFLIFHLARPDVFPLKDLGLQKAINLHYGSKKALTLEQMGDLGEQWKPWRTVATWYLWRALDPVPVEY